MTVLNLKTEFTLPTLDLSAFTRKELIELQGSLPRLLNVIVEEHEHLPMVLPHGLGMISKALDVSPEMARKFVEAEYNAVHASIAKMMRNDDKYDCYGLGNSSYDFILASPLYGLMLLKERRRLSRIANDYYNEKSGYAWQDRITDTHTVKRVIATCHDIYGTGGFTSKDITLVKLDEVADVCTKVTGQLYSEWLSSIESQITGILNVQTNRQTVEA